MVEGMQEWDKRFEKAKKRISLDGDGKKMRIIMDGIMAGNGQKEKSG
jgi:hypothetical protein